MLYLPTNLLFAMVPISRTNAYAQQASWFIFNLKIKNRVSHAHILMIAVIGTHQTQSSLPYTTHITSYILWAPEHCQHHSKWVHPWSSVKADLVFPLTTWYRSPTTSHRWLGLAILSLACPNLAVDFHLNSNTYESHRYASRLKQHEAQCYG